MMGSTIYGQTLEERVGKGKGAAEQSAAWIYRLPLIAISVAL
jgi:hypothetical protein